MFPIKEERDLNSNQNNNRGKGGGNKRNMTAIVSILLWALVLTLLVNLATSRLQQANSVEVSYGQFRQLIMQDAVESVVMASGKYTFTLKEGYSLSVGEDGEVTVRTPEEGGQDSQAAQAPQESGTTGGVLDLPLLDGTAPQQQQPVQSQNQAQSAGGRESLVYFCAPLTDDIPELVSLMEAHGITNFGPEYVEPINPILSVLLSWVLPMVLIMVVFSLLMRGMAGKMGGGIGNLGKSNAKVYVERKTGVTFKDVAGQDEAKESLVEIIDFLHNPQKYTEIGAKLPKGALLVGPPGTGKTLLAKAVAGEANVPFFSISGSDFVEMFVGMGAARVRDLFKEANKMAPCIVFIDEIDTIGKSRDNRMGGNDEREQTLNQLLAEMDGFDPTKGVILLAATNRPEVLDQALLRPGRFDRRIIVDRPNLAGRLATLQVHTRNIRLAEDVNLRKIAIATAGTVGADLANLVNEAALRAVRLGRKAVNQEDLLAAFELVIAGAEKKGSVLSEFEKKLVAYHEVGHAMVAYRQKHAEPVSKITIVPHTQGALGYTLHLPEEDKHLHTRDELLAQITVSMGGRVAEELVLHTMTNGAAQDIQDATGIARNMVAMFGMSDEFGMMALASRRSQYLDGGYGIDCAQDTAAAMDRAVRDLIDACYKKAVEILSHSREDMDKVVEYLLEKETITGAEMVAILEGRDPALADNFPDPDGKGTAGPPAEPVSDPIPLSGGEPQPPDGGGMEFGPEGKPKE
ncbi:MAG: ATP-dependent zinc metalloprotease FtsH [Flavonifractor plautii]|uniref:ATP-dependent zinc metalloprotease FtsH n=1 Tax=uncultured Flavonifractor sp. TaxID=1193534 RepID=UPI001D75899C|nr:ATP-dependent zinc metalloprotease FtsH [uncultured Flavonifractor sp.]MDU3778561.1 ATP-dependent zinc metalloprotease FtsH [Flavonifractor plautii]HJF02284.1 ATP-dependent zinc metalloprotease FtsH [Flavonifractor plautii]